MHSLFPPRNIKQWCKHLKAFVCVPSPPPISYLAFNKAAYTGSSSVIVHKKQAFAVVNWKDFPGKTPNLKLRLFDLLPTTGLEHFKGNPLKHLQLHLACVRCSLMCRHPGTALITPWKPSPPQGLERSSLSRGLEQLGWADGQEVKCTDHCWHLIFHSCKEKISQDFYPTWPANFTVNLKIQTIKTLKS